MKNIRLYMFLQWVFFLPIILPLCILFGALRGAFQMVERVLDQLWIDVVPEANTNANVQTDV